VASYVGLGGLGVLQRQAADELSFVPASAELIAYADVRQLMDSELRQRLQPGSDVVGDHGPDQLLEQTGINIETDIDSVVVAVLPVGGAPTGDGTLPDASRAPASDMPLLLARGRFDRGRIEALLLGQGGSAAMHSGTWLVTSGSQDLGVAFIESDLIAVGPPASVVLLLETHAAGAGSIRDNDDVMRLVSRVDQGSAWTVVRFETLRNRPALPAALASQLPAITWFAASGQVDSGVAATIHAETRDAQAAQDLGEVIRGFVALARMQIGPQPAFAAVIDSIQLSTEGTTVTLGFSVPPDVIDRLGTMVQPRTPAAAPTPIARPLGTPSI
jgi:hypothetical protein